MRDGMKENTVPPRWVTVAMFLSSLLGTVISFGGSLFGVLAMMIPFNVNAD
jgi:hypothetical protein